MRNKCAPFLLLTKEKTHWVKKTLSCAGKHSKERDKELQGGVEFTGKADDVEESWQREGVAQKSKPSQPFPKMLREDPHHCPIPGGMHGQQTHSLSVAN